MKLLNRLVIFLLVTLFYIGANAYELPSDDVIFMQVETKVDALESQETDSLFSYDNGVIALLAKAKCSRFSLKTTAGDELLDDLHSTFVFSEQINGDRIEYYISPLLEKYVVVSGEKVNLQVSVSGGVTTIGYPMIDVGF